MGDMGQRYCAVRSPLLDPVVEHKQGWRQQSHSNQEYKIILCSEFYNCLGYLSPLLTSRIANSIPRIDRIEPTQRLGPSTELIHPLLLNGSRMLPLPEEQRRRVRQVVEHQDGKVRQAQRRQQPRADLKGRRSVDVGAHQRREAQAESEGRRDGEAGDVPRPPRFGPGDGVEDVEKDEHYAGGGERVLELPSC